MPVGKPVPQTLAASRIARANGRPVPLDHGDNASTRSDESARYQASVDYLRANGCRCVLRWDGQQAVPLSTAEALGCPAVNLHAPPKD